MGMKQTQSWYYAYGIPEEERKKRTVAEELLNEPKPPLEDSWEPLEPHEV